VKKRVQGILQLDPQIDTLILGCTHYPLLMSKILKYTPAGVRLVPQGEYVASSLADYLQRYPEIDKRLTRGGTCQYLTTEQAQTFNESAALFMHEHVEACSVTLNEQ